MTRNKYKQDTLKIAFRFKGLTYLVADHKGVFYSLSHFDNFRTKPFKKLKSSKYRVNYKGTPYSLSTLRNIHIKVNEKIEV